MQAVPRRVSDTTRAFNSTTGGKRGSLAVLGLNNNNLDVQRHNLRAWAREAFSLDLQLGPGLQELRTGVLLCKIAGMIELAHTKASVAEGKPWKPMRIKFNSKATVGSFFAKDNINRFLAWCGRYIDQAYHFGLDDLSGNADRDGAVLGCLAELARCEYVASTPLDLIERQIHDSNYQPDVPALTAVADPLFSAHGLSIEAALENGAFQLKGEARRIYLAVIDDTPVVCSQQAATASPFPWMTIPAFASATPAKPRPSVARVLQSLESQVESEDARPSPLPRGAKPKMVRLSDDAGADSSTLSAALPPLQGPEQEAAFHRGQQEQTTTTTPATSSTSTTEKTAPGRDSVSNQTEAESAAQECGGVSSEKQGHADGDGDSDMRNRTRGSDGTLDDACGGSASTDTNRAENVNSSSSSSTNVEGDGNVPATPMSEPLCGSSPLSRVSSALSDSLPQRRPLPLPKPRRSVAFDSGGATPRSRKTSLAAALATPTLDRAPSGGAQRHLPASTPSASPNARSPSSGRLSCFSSTARSSTSATPAASHRPSGTNLLSSTSSNGRHNVLPVPRKLRQQPSSHQVQSESTGCVDADGNKEAQSTLEDQTAAQAGSPSPTAQTQRAEVPVEKESSSGATAPAMITITEEDLNARVEAFANEKLAAMARSHQMALEGLRQERDGYARRLKALEEAAEEVETNYDAKLKALQQERDDALNTARGLQEEVATLRKDLALGKNESNARAQELERELESIKKMQQQQPLAASEDSDELSSVATPLTPRDGSATEPVFFSRLKSSFKASCDDMLRSLGPHDESTAKKIPQLEEALATAEEEFQAEKAASGFRMAALSSQVYALEQDKRNLEDKLAAMQHTISSAVQQLLPLSSVDACKQQRDPSPADKRRSVHMHPATML